MSRKLILVDVLKEVVGEADAVFATLDISKDARVRNAHPELVSHRNYNAFVGGALSDHHTVLGIVEVKTGTEQGSHWQKHA